MGFDPMLLASSLAVAREALHLLQAGQQAQKERRETYGEQAAVLRSQIEALGELCRTLLAVKEVHSITHGAAEQLNAHRELIVVKFREESLTTAEDSWRQVYGMSTSLLGNLLDLDAARYESIFPSLDHIQKDIRSNVEQIHGILRVGNRDEAHRLKTTYDGILTHVNSILRQADNYMKDGVRNVERLGQLLATLNDRGL